MMQSIFSKLSVLLFLFTLFYCVSCNEQKDRKEVTEEELPTNHLDLNIYAKNHIESELSIPVNEKYTLSIHKENLDGDDKIDAIILVNRYEYALEEAARSVNPAKQAELGFMGNYNYFFYFDGALNLISPPLVIPSSPMLPLKVSFENISSSSFKDILIDFRIRNSSYKDYYTVTNHSPRRIFQWKIFDGLGTPSEESFIFNYETGSYSESKDIVISKGRIGAIPKKADLFIYEPVISAENKQETLYRFFYLPQKGIYATNK